ncbi:DUF4174 domain-containing protein [Dyadobacter beijingensis]|nr:DUF4174 domain-containing protein [Dyadobacter beijingensis]
MKILLTILILIAAMPDQPREVLLFYTKDGLEKQKAQATIFDAHRQDIRERDIKVTLVTDSEKDSPQWKKWDVDRANSFTFILVGRDGGEKLRSAEVVSAEKLFGLIDAMPMRKNELKEKARGGK